MALIFVAKMELVNSLPLGRLIGGVRKIVDMV